MEKICHANTDQKKLRMVILIPDQVYFRAKSITKQINDFVTIKEWFHQKDWAIQRFYTLLVVELMSQKKPDKTA